MYNDQALPRGLATIRLIGSRWEALCAAVRARNVGAARSSSISFVEALGSLLGFQDITPRDTLQPLPLLLCDRQIRFPPTRLRGFDRTLHVMVSSRLRPTRIDYGRLKDMVGRSGLGLRIFFVISPGHTPALKAQASADRCGLVVLDAADIGQILESPSPRTTLNRAVCRYVDIDLIQPYDQYGVAHGPMFFGREKEVQRILSCPERSFAVFGGRRVGKTSLLRKVEAELNRDSSNSVIFLSAQGVKSNVDICAKIVNAMLGPKVDPEARSNARSLDYFANFVRRYVLTSGQRWVILVDEIDELVFIDRQRRQEVMATLRALDSELRQRCRFVFAGFRMLYESLLSYHSPVMNFVDPIVLEQLDVKSARRLVWVPTHDDLGYDFTSAQLVDRVIDYASRHPCHLQHFCSLLLQHVHERGESAIGEEDIEVVFESSQFRDGLMETFHWNTTPLQKLIVYLFLDSGGFTVPDVHSALSKIGMPVDSSEVINALSRLVRFGHLRRAWGRYVFAHAKFPIIVRESAPVDFLIRELLKEMKARKKRRS